MDRREFVTRTALAAGGLAIPESRLTRAGPRVQDVRVNGERLNRQLAELSAFGRNAEGGIDRVAYSEADRAGREYVLGLMREAGLAVRIDTAGNLLGRREGEARGPPPLLFGSHIDSVPGGGNYDGPVGSLSAIEAARTLVERRITTRHPLEVVIFQNEENGKIGSKAMRGEDPASYLDFVTNSGRTVRDGIRFIGGDPERLSEARREPGSIAAYLELHIEQGGVLEREGIPIGAVEGIVGIKRWAVTVNGFANHAGTTPMDQRQDALLAAARFIDLVPRIVTSVPGAQVATVGTIAVEPGAANVIPGRARLTLEMRDLELAKLDALFEELRSAADGIGEVSGVRFAFEEIYKSEPARADDRVRAIIAESARELALDSLSLPSGAGHDAQEIARLAPMGMIFVPSRGGISHSPKEYTAPAQIANGADVLLRTVLALDRAAF
jgi:N-carbamoyl-L-amino-acid hydrolase